MPYTLSIDDSEKSAEIISQVSPIIEGHYRHLLDHINTLNTVVPLDEFEVLYLSGSLYKYEWKTKDGRTWTQTLKIDPPNEIEMTFEVSDFFKFSELRAHRDARDHVDAEIRMHGITKISVNWF